MPHIDHSADGGGDVDAVGEGGVVTRSSHLCGVFGVLLLKLLARRAPLANETGAHGECHLVHAINRNPNAE